MNPSIINFNKLLYNHIASIFRDVSYLPDDFFDLLIEYSKDEKYPAFNKDTISYTIEKLYIDFIEHLVNENKESLKEYFESIYDFIANLDEDISSFHQLPILIMLFEKKDIDNINSITNYIHDIIKNNPQLIVDYLKNSVEN